MENLNIGKDLQFNINNISSHILDSMNDLVSVIDKNGQRIYSNHSMDILRERLDEEDLKILRRISKTTFTVKTTFIDEISLDGKIYSVKSSPLFDSKGQVLFAVEVFRDISVQTSIRNELFKANKKMIDDIKFAKIIQTSILPRNREFSGYVFDYRYEPSEQLSGDMFDLIKVDDERYCVYIADVVGHGVSASIMTMFIRQTVRSIISEGKISLPNDLLNELLRRFKDLNLDSSQYFSIFYGLIDLRSKRFIYSNGGHNSTPILFREDKIIPLEGKGKFISNIFSDIDYDEEIIEIKEGDELLLYTDGVIETTNIDNEQFGVSGIISSKEDEGNLLDNIIDRINRFRWGEQIDDLALVYIKRKDME